ncbi:LysR family transcriptional regulator (plasmid) [Pantoea agglomerans]|uniref:LysR family transcriptional regulator n=1 Tax=Enterobacter agglomerans TaxID=549 RepID=UPI0007E557D0|nr:LysR family transcriptional regulator [Pantoea agglomerans]WHU89968.1 LysR family transcriptional regulator [Pantoea agglomerans pv. gypsophilae]WNN36636.1 LysR family transcriptional regulator [Pantoea agglomerans]
MLTIRENDFHRIDLNLLTVLLVLKREGSVSRAAEKLHLGQPAVSNALARLRVMFSDPLFVRTARGMEPTPRAEALIAELGPLMAQMQNILFQPVSFTPSEATHVFRLGMSDWVERWLMPELYTKITRTAPGVTLQVTASDPFRDAELVARGEIDLAISVGESTPATLQREKIVSHHFCTLWHPQQLSLPAPLTLEDYVAHAHLLVSYRGATWSAIDDELAALGKARSIRYVTPHFSSLPPLLARTPALATVPAGLADNWVTYYGLCSSPVPVATPEIPLSLLWHKRCDNDKALCWLKEELRSVMTDRT